MANRNLGLGLGFSLVVFLLITPSESNCTKGCPLALASYYIWNGSTLPFVAEMFNLDTQTQTQTILNYNPQLSNQNSLPPKTRMRIPFSCNCIQGKFLGHTFSYKVRSHFRGLVAEGGDSYERVANLFYSNLTTVDWLEKFNSYAPEKIPDENAWLNVTVNCSCGDKSISKDYGLFLSYPLRPGENLSTVANETGLPEQLIRDYNRNSRFDGSGLVYIPDKDLSGSYPALKLSKGMSGGVIAGITVAVAAVFFLAIFTYVCSRRNRLKKASRTKWLTTDFANEHGAGNSWNRSSESTAVIGRSPLTLNGVAAERSVEFSYEELAKATDNFSLANKIGEGGYGAVFYAELRCEKAAIKKMDMQATKEFLAELEVLTHVHHLNLVRLIGYCVEGSLFLVYEFIENGNLSQHLRGSGRQPLTWSTRLQIALDSARGLEYIHEHTVPVYIHRDIKSANILIDHNFHGKVADFGLAKLTEVGVSLQTRLVGTFGYMPPEYAHRGHVSTKVDVFAFGVVLYELISAKEAIVKVNGSFAESKGLVSVFEEILNQPDPREDLCKLIDPRLEDNYPFNSVLKLAKLAKACTHENPQLRPSIRSVVVALMTLSSSTEGEDIGSLYENEALMNLMAGR